MEHETIYINDVAKSFFQKLGCGIVDSIIVYRKEGSDWFISAGTGRFKSDADEVKLFSV